MTNMVPNLMPVMPEIILAVGAMLLLMVGVFRPTKAFSEVSTLSLLLLVITGGVLYFYVGGETQITFGGMFISDSFAVYTKVLILIGSFLSIVMAGPYLKDHMIDRFEFPVLIILATLGMFAMVSANSLMSLYVGLELQSLSLYVLAAFNRDRNRSTESGLKYFVLGALSSGMLLYGISLIYGFTGSVDFDVLALTLEKAGSGHLGLTLGLVFILAGLAFKVSAVPFHMWAPDVYEGAPTPVTSFFATAPKIAALALFVRVMMGPFADMIGEWQQVVIFLSVASMLVGAFVALMQTNIKRLMAYSSIGHVGYALMAIVIGTSAGVEALMVYLVFYLTMTIGTFGAILSMRHSDGMVEDINDLAGLSTNNLPLAISIAIFMFSLAGIPLLAGFFGKYYVFLAVVEAGFVPLAVIGVVTSVVGAFYYLRIIKIMFFDDAAVSFEKMESRSLNWVIGVTALINSPASVFLIAPVAAMAAWAALSFAG